MCGSVTIVLLFFIFHSGEKDRASVQSVVGNQELPVDQNQLLAREMSASYQEVFIPLGSDTLLREQYLNFFQMVR